MNGKPAAFFEPSVAVVKRARKVMAGYTISIRPSSGGFIGSSLELPGVIAGADTMEECARKLAFSLETVIASYLVDGEQPPPAASRETRSEQVNVRFTPTERDCIEQESTRQGFRGVGDLIRAEMIRLFGPVEGRPVARR